MGKTLVAGSAGGREHALGLAMTECGERVAFTHGGNGGTRELGFNLPNSDNSEIAERAASLGINLAIVGPEAPLIDGLANKLRAEGIPTFGPGADGAMLEASKIFSAEFNAEYGIPQPETTIPGSLAEAEDFVMSNPATSFVTKAAIAKWAAGKGALLDDTTEAALASVRSIMSGEMFGEHCKEVLFQRRLNPAGREVSAFYVIDGTHFTLLPLTQDHKRLLDGDRGLNTGGTGAYVHVPDTDAIVDQLMEQGDKIMYGLKKRGIDYRGVLFDGVMEDVDDDLKIKTIEYNVRFGDPESQPLTVVAPELGINLFELLDSAANGSIDPEIRGRYLGSSVGNAAITVCLMAGDYPKGKDIGNVIRGLKTEQEGVTIHHGGTRYDEERRAVVTNGGRIVYITATGGNIDEAAARAYGAIGEENGGVWFPDMHYRRDIAYQARTIFRQP